MKQIFPDEYSNKRFWSFVDIKTPDDCWLWTGPTNGKGYGIISSCGKHTVTSRLVVFGPKPTTPLLALHHCDNSLCLNPAHLYAGTSQDNSDDRMRRGRHVKRGCRRVK